MGYKVELGVRGAVKKRERGRSKGEESNKGGGWMGVEGENSNRSEVRESKGRTGIEEGEGEGESNREDKRMSAI